LNELLKIEKSVPRFTAVILFGSMPVSIST